MTCDEKQSTLVLCCPFHQLFLIEKKRKAAYR
jgi:hypothetical protein